VVTQLSVHGEERSIQPQIILMVFIVGSEQTQGVEQPTHGLAPTNRTATVSPA
jgi:hypothetical protein